MNIVNISRDSDSCHSNRSSFCVMRSCRVDSWTNCTVQSVQMLTAVCVRGLGSGPTLHIALFLKEPSYSYNSYKPSLEDDVWLADSAVVNMSFFFYLVIWKWIGDKLSINARSLIIKPAEYVFKMMGEVIQKQKSISLLYLKVAFIL